MREDIIELSCSPYTSPLVAIRKKEGKVRLCLDAREIKRMLINDRTSPDSIDEIMKRFHGLKYISSCYTVCGYWQIELHPNSRQYVAFIFEGRNYQFKILPFRLINSVAVLIKCTWINYLGIHYCVCGRFANNIENMGRTLRKDIYSITQIRT